MKSLKATPFDQDPSKLEKEIDIWLIRDNLKLSFEERVRQHQNTLDFIDELKEMASEEKDLADLVSDSSCFN